MHMFASAYSIAVLTRLGVIVLAAFCGGITSVHAAEGSSAGQLARIYGASVTLDGSPSPPGDTVTVKALVARGTVNADLEIRAFIVSGEGNSKQEPVKAKGDGFRGVAGEFVAESALVKDTRAVSPPHREAPDRPMASTETRSIAFNREVVIPYGALDVAPGEHFLGYVASLVIDGEAVAVFPLPLTRLIVTDRVRTTLDESIPVVKSRPETITQELWVMKNGKLVPRTHTVTKDVPFCESKTSTHEVKIPGEYLRENVYGGNESPTRRDAFAPSDQRTIFFGTNRVEVSPSGPAVERFGDTSIDADKPVSYGSYQVSVPQIKRKRGTVNQPERVWYFWTEKPDPKKHFVILDQDPKSKPRLTLAELGHELGDHDTIVYVHGFNNTFEDAVVRAAQLQHDLQFGGNMMVFSWPSAGKTAVDVNLESLTSPIKLAYDLDKKEAEKSVPFLADALTQIVAAAKRAHPDAKVHVIAHSMGNHLLLKALSTVEQERKRTGNPKLQLGEVILAAPDVVGTDFAQLHQSMSACCERVTFYCSSEDKALKVSRLRNQDKPIGLVPVVLPDGAMDTILANGTTETFYELGHSYFGDSALLLADIGLVVTFHQPPLERRPPLGRRVEADSRNGFYFELGEEWLP